MLFEARNAKLARAAAHLRDLGRLVVLAPAHNLLLSPFEASLGRLRRYDRRSLTNAARPVPGLCLECVRPLDSCGLLVSVGNRQLLRLDMPTLKRVFFWDCALVPASRALDPLLRHRLGKSILAIWTKTSALSHRL